jgi:hypothetical protein
MNMFNEVQGLIQRVTTGEIDASSMQQAAADHVNTMDHPQLMQHLQTARDNANQNGQSGIAQQITGLLSQHGSNPQGLKQQAISLLSSNPQILQHFEPAFAKNILSKF